MKKIISLTLILTILLTNIISAAKFSLSEITDQIDSNTLILLLTFAISFILLFFLLNHLIKSNNTAPAILALVFSSGITYWINQVEIVGDWFFDLGFQEETLYILIPIIALAFIIFLIAKLKKNSLLVFGGLLLLASLFVESKEITIALGAFLLVIWLFLLLKRKGPRTPRGPRPPKEPRPPRQRNRKKLHNKWNQRKNRRNETAQKQHQRIRQTRHNKWTKRKNRRNETATRQNPTLNRTNSPRAQQIKQQKIQARQHQRARKLRHAQWTTRKGYRNVKKNVGQKKQQIQRITTRKARHARWATRKGYRNVKKGISQRQQARTQKQQQRGRRAIEESKQRQLIQQQRQVATQERRIALHQTALEKQPRQKLLPAPKRQAPTYNKMQITSNIASLKKSFNEIQRVDPRDPRLYGIIKEVKRLRRQK